MSNDPKATTAARPALIGSLVAAVALLLFSVVPVLANPVPTNPDPPIECPDAFGSGLITKYVTTVSMPTDSNDWWVSVEVTLADEPGGQAASCELTLATYELPGPDFMFPQTLHVSQTGTFGAGTHTLTAALPVPGGMPDCFSQFDFVFGAPIAELVFENRYGDRQIRSRIVPSSTAECPVIEVVPPVVVPPVVVPPVVVPPVVVPQQEVLASTPAPTPRAQVAGSTSVPNTSTDSTTPTALALLGSLVLVATLGSLVGLSSAKAPEKE